MTASDQEHNEIIDVQRFNRLFERAQTSFRAHIDQKHSVRYNVPHLQTQFITRSNKPGRCCIFRCSAFGTVIEQELCHSNLSITCEDKDFIINQIEIAYAITCAEMGKRHRFLRKMQSILRVTLTSTTTWNKADRIVNVHKIVSSRAQCDEYIRSIHKDKRYGKCSAQCNTNDQSPVAVIVGADPVSADSEQDEKHYENHNSESEEPVRVEPSIFYDVHNDAHDLSDADSETSNGDSSQSSVPAGNAMELDENVKTMRFTLCRFGFDGAWHNCVYKRSSMNGCVNFIERFSRKILHWDTRTKGVNYPKDASSGNMEGEMFVYGIKFLQDRHIHPHDISIDGDNKLPKLVAKINQHSQVLNRGLDPIKLSSDVAHFKKNLVSRIFKFKKLYDWSASEYDVRGFTFNYSKLVVDRMFQYAFHAPEIETVEDAKRKVHDVLLHMMPDEVRHLDCRYRRLTFCKTAHGNAAN